MKMVTTTRAIPPYHKGQTVLVRDAIAEKLVASGEACNPQPSPFPEPAEFKPYDPKGPARSLRPARTRGGSNG
jgi:hypothetical protein